MPVLIEEDLYDSNISLYVNTSDLVNLPVEIEEVHGIPTQHTLHFTPPLYSGITQISCSISHTMALKENGDVVGWGDNSVKQVNPSSVTDPWIDTTTVIVTGCKQISTGLYFNTIALKENGDVIGWGSNNSRKTNPSSGTTPWIDTTTVMATGCKQIACGQYHTLALKENGDVIGWGSNNYGQVNPNSATDPWTDTTTVIVTGCKQIACGNSFTIALKENGDVIGWGYNYTKQVNPSSATTPWIDTTTVIVTGCKQIVCGDANTMALKENGDVIGWGANDYNCINPQYGSANPWTDTTTVMATGCKQISTIYFHTMALKENGDVIGWGYNAYKNVNPDSATNPWIDTTTVMATGCEQIKCGHSHTMALKENGDVVGWGSNGNRRVNPASATTPWIDTTNVVIGDTLTTYMTFQLNNGVPVEFVEGGADIVSDEAYTSIYINTASMGDTPTEPLSDNFRIGVKYKFKDIVENHIISTILNDEQYYIIEVGVRSMNDANGTVRSSLPFVPGISIGGDEGGGTTKRLIMAKNGQSLTIEYIPDDGSILDYITVDGDNYGGTTSPYIFENITENHSFMVSFNLPM